MISYLSGKILIKNSKRLIIEVSGVGYQVAIPSNSLQQLGQAGDLVSLFIYTHVREDALLLFGFIDEFSLDVFECLISVNGIGTKVALTILSTMTPFQLIGAIQNSDHGALTKVPGIGAKSAQRLVLELKGKLPNPNLPLFAQKNSEYDLIRDLRSAIENLGFRPKEIDSAVEGLKPLIKRGLPLESLLTEALQKLSQ